MTGEAIGEHGINCENCRTLNPPGAIVCRSCGVHLRSYATLRTQIEERDRQRAIEQAEQLRAQTSEVVADEIQRGRRDLRHQLQQALAAVAVLAALAVAATLVARAYARERQERLVALEAGAAACMSRGDYICARDGYLHLLGEEVGYPGARAGLQNARYELAAQFSRAGQWPDAVDELDALLRQAPDDEQALTLLRETYDRWYQDALAHGDMITATRVRLQKHVRFPPLPMPTGAGDT